MATTDDPLAAFRDQIAAAKQQAIAGSLPDYSAALAGIRAGGTQGAPTRQVPLIPGSHLARLAQGERMMRGVSPEAFGQMKTALEGIRTTVRADVAAGNYTQIGPHIQSAVESLRGALPQARGSFPPQGTPRPLSPERKARRVTRLTARRDRISARIKELGG